MDFLLCFVPPSPAELSQQECASWEENLCYCLISVFCQGHWQKPKLSCYKREEFAKILIFSTNFSVRDLNDNTEDLYACHFTVVLVDWILQAVVIYSVLKTDSTTHE